jgi:hypothetical protein
MQLSALVMGVAQVVHREHERLAALLQRRHQLGELSGRPGVEAEVDVEHVELVAMTPDPFGLEHARRPPGRELGRPGRRRVREADDAVVHARRW